MCMHAFHMCVSGRVVVVGGATSLGEGVIIKFYMKGNETLRS